MQVNGGTGQTVKGWKEMLARAVKQCHSKRKRRRIVEGGREVSHGNVATEGQTRQLTTGVCVVCGVLCGVLSSLVCCCRWTAFRLVLSLYQASNSLFVSSWLN